MPALTEAGMTCTHAKVGEYRHLVGTTIAPNIHIHVYNNYYRPAHVHIMCMYVVQSYKCVIEALLKTVIYR